MTFLKLKVVSKLKTLRLLAHQECRGSRTSHLSSRCYTVLSPDISVKSEQQMYEFVDFLLKKNKVLNLTAIQTHNEAWERHVKDSLALLPLIEQHCCSSGKDTVTAIDVGSGAGLPGMILALARPDWQMTLLDSLQKRCNFLQQATELLQITNVRIICSRAEVAGQDPLLREKFDVALARAVADLSILSELCLPFVNIGGAFVAAKGPNPKEEVSRAQVAITTLGGQLRGVSPVESYGAEGKRTAVTIKKIQSTPLLYPRREGRPQKRPL